ncbi:MAG: glycosyltransferase family 2 protein [Spirochaetales bacterium]|nr:glycosyltransferase family 2 protein [Spirochaetales bacterium]
MTPIVSVIIPVFNRLALLKKAVASVYAQTFRDFELIVVDDGSVDKTAQWLASADIRHLVIAHSGMPGLVRNRGAEIAKGKYLSFLDSDDVWKPEKLEKQISFFNENPGLEICHTREIWNRQGKIISQTGQKHNTSGKIFKDALQKCIIGPSTVMLSRTMFEHYGGFCESLEIAEDYELWLRITANHSIGYIDTPLVEKNGGHGDQLSGKYGHIEKFRIQALQQALKHDCFSIQQRKLLYETLYEKCTIFANGAIKRGKTDVHDSYRKEAMLYKAKADEIG